MGLRGEGVEPQRKRAGGQLQPILGEFCSPWGKKPVCFLHPPDGQGWGKGAEDREMT